MKPPLATRADPAPVEIVSPALRGQLLGNMREWEIPTDIILALPTASALKAVIYARQANRDWPLPISKLYLRDGHYYAEVPFFGASRPALFYPIDVWPLDVQPKREPRP